MTNVFGTNLVTVDGDAVTTGQKAIADSAQTVITTSTGPLTHGIFIVVKDDVGFYVGASDVSETTGVKVSLNNPLFVPIKDPSSLFAAQDGSGDKTLTFIMY